MVRGGTVLRLTSSICIAALASTSCGKKKSDNNDEPSEVANLIAAGGLTLLPSMTGLIATNPSANLTLADADAPLVKDLTNALTDKYFFDNSIAALNAVADQTAWNNLSQAAKDKIRGDFSSRDGYAGGDGACQMMQKTGEAIDSLISTGSTSCFLKEIPSAAAGGTWKKADGSTLENPKSAFAQDENDKLTRVQIKNFSEQGQTFSFYVFAKIFGRSTLGAGKYKAQLYFCQNLTGSPMQGGESGPGGSPSFEVDTTTGVFTATEANSTYTATVTSFLKASADGKLAFDLTKDRGADTAWTNGGYTGKTSFTVTGDNEVISKSYFEGTGFTNKNFSISRITGDGTQTLRFIEGAYKGEGTGNGFTFSYSGGAAFDGFYKADSAHPYVAELPSNFSDSFFAVPTITAPDLSGFTCDATPDIVGEADFSVTEMNAVKETCNGGRISNDNNFWEMCQQAQDKKQFIWGN